MGQITTMEGSNKWYVEHMSGGKMFAGVKLNETLVTKKTKFQEAQVVDLQILGKVLTLDGCIQSTEFDERIYHEFLVHPSLLFHPCPKKVFIGGGGEGATAREVLRHKSLEKCVMVDIDGECVDFCKEHLPQHNTGVFEHEKMKLIIDDAKAQIENAKDGEYDVMIQDLADPTEGGPCYQLYTKEFYELCSKKLGEDGILVTQATQADKFNAEEAYTPIANTLKQVFPHVFCYTVHIPSFFGIWGFVICFKKQPKNDLFCRETIDKLIEERLLDPKALEMYDGEAHIRAFSLNKFLRRSLEKEERVIKKDNYVFVK